MKTLKVLIIFFLFSLSYTVSAQQNKKIQKLIAKKDYVGAIKEYEKEYNEKANKVAAIRIGDLYSKLKDYPNAYAWYNRETAQLKKYNLSILKYADACKYMGEYQKALDNYILYAIEVNDPDAVLEKSQLCETLLKAKNQSYLFQAENLPFNTPEDETNLSILRNNTIMSSNRGNKNTNQNDFYMFVREHDKWLEPTKIQKELPSNISHQSISYTEDGNKVVFSNLDLNFKANEQKGEKPNAKIYFATNLGNQWLDIKPFEYNSDKYACSYPSFNKTGTLLIFASDMEGGYGGYDLYFSELEGAQWKEPRNLGPLVNSKEDEITPYFVEIDGDEWVYFSSNSPVGFGGFDIYKSQVVDNTFLTGELLPPPINSSNDDISFVFEPGKRGGFFASNRSGGKGGMDAYNFKAYNLKIQVKVIDDKTSTPIDYSEIKLLHNSVKIDEALTDTEGKAELQVGKNATYNLIVNKEGYLQNNLKVTTENTLSNDSVQAQIKLVKDLSYKPKSNEDPYAANAISFKGKVLGYDGNAVPGQVRMVNFQTGKIKIFDAESNGTFEVFLLSNNNYKIIIDYDDQHIEDEITTYGMQNGTSKSRTYNLNFGNKSKITENYISDEEDLLASNKQTTKKQTPKSTNSKEANTNTPKTAEKIEHKETPKQIEQQKKEVPAIEVSSSKTKIEEEPVAIVSNNNKQIEKNTPISEKTPTLETKISDKQIDQKQAPELKENNSKNIEQKNNTQVNLPIENKTEALSESKPIAMNTSQPIPTKVQPSKSISSEKLVYKIQLGAYTEKNIDFSYIYGLGNIEIKPSSSGQYIYSLGNFNNIDDARLTLDKVRDKGLFIAFIVCYYNDEKMSIIK
jgi:hypothetical protein